MTQVWPLVIPECLCPVMWKARGRAGCKTCMTHSLNPCAAFGSHDPKVHNEPSLCCENFTQYKNKAYYVSDVGGLRQPDGRKKMLHFVFVCGKVVAIWWWVTMTDGSEWPKDNTRVEACQMVRLNTSSELNVFSAGRQTFIQTLFLEKQQVINWTCEGWTCISSCCIIAHYSKKR